MASSRGQHVGVHVHFVGEESHRIQGIGSDDQVTVDAWEHPAENLHPAIVAACTDSEAGALDTRAPPSLCESGRRLDG
ncbi:hypothetical protein ABT173_22015 [Streptomyces sp. NPDC001795]|uniref:hypothetical protein n=1 Tax=unclassified Streptomyces TaxID=2593676 RepID=UPI00331AF684